MKFYMAEQEAFDELAGAQTLGDVVRIGFNRVDFTDKNGKMFKCWEMTNDGKVIGHTYDSEFNSVEIMLDTDIKINQMSVCIDRDEDQYTIISVEESLC